MYGSTIERNYRILKETYYNYIHWASTYSVVFAPKKYEVIHLTRARKKFNLKATPILDRLRINIKDHIRVLGIQVDPKLK